MRDLFRPEKISWDVVDVAKLPLVSQSATTLFAKRFNLPVFRHPEIKSNIFYLDPETETLYDLGDGSSLPDIHWKKLVTFTETPELTLLSKKEYGVLDVQKTLSHLPRRIKRSLSLADNLEQDFRLEAFGSERANIIMTKLQKFIFLKTMKPSYSIMRFQLLQEDAERDQNFLLGSLRVDQQEVIFLMHRFPGIILADLHATLSSHPSKINLTSHMHFHLLKWCSKNDIPFYSLGVIEDPSLKDYETIAEYKRQWGPQIYSEYFYVRDISGN